MVAAIQPDRAATGRILIFIVLIFVTASCSTSRKPTGSSAPPTLTELKVGFRDIPNEARLRVFWWWLNSMATEESITKDLEEMQAKGFGGALIFDAGSSNYAVAHKTPAGPVFLSEGWMQLLEHAVREADRLGLELSMNITSGWNPGGPHITPADALKKLTLKEIRVKGPVRYDELLPLPDTLLYYQDITVQAFPADVAGNPPSQILNWDIKSLNRALGWKGIYPLYKLREAGSDPAVVLDPDKIIRLDKHFSNGRLQWNVPPGDWIIVRYGYTCTGARVSTASDGWDGLSFDHLSREALKKHFSVVAVPIIERAQKAGKSLKYVATDSWEMGVANWTADFQREFRKYRGYDMMQYLPVLTNRVVGSRELSDRFLKDFRLTVGDCVAENCYGLFRDLAADYGLMIHPEAGGPHSAPVDGLRVLGIGGMPMGEFWARSNTHRVAEAERLCVKQSASAAHIYGKRFVAAEGPTSIGPQWERSPRDQKNVLDRIFCAGVNRIFWHTYTSSPDEFVEPGNEYFAGTHLNRHATWWSQAGTFTAYINRCSFLLSQGLFRADVLWYYGDDVPNYVFLQDELKELPFGYGWDKCNAEVLLTRASVKNGRLVLPDGMEYPVLVMPPEPNPNPKVLKMVEKFRKQGLTVVESDPAGALKTLDIGPDFSFTSPLMDTKLDWIHRTAGEADIYFVVNRNARYGVSDTLYRYNPTPANRYESVECSFRVTGKIPELWDPLTGSIIPITGYTEEKGRTLISLKLPPEGSAFIVFSPGPKSDISGNLLDIHQFMASDWPEPGFSDGKNIRIKNMEGPWSLRFYRGSPPPASRQVDELKSWTDFEDTGIRFYSGKGAYNKTMDFNPDELRAEAIILDLGNVQEIAEVFVNNQSAGVLWTDPFRVEITPWLKPGTNDIRIEVINLWPNRLIGDGQLPDSLRSTRTNVKKFEGPGAMQFLRVSGLLGPVRLVFVPAE